MRKIAPSMMCVPFEVLPEYLRVFEAEGIEYLHLDIMDGTFVPNIMLGTEYAKQMRRLSRIPLDIHLMVERPEEKIPWFDIQPGEMVSVHAESTNHLQRALAMIKSRGAKATVALNPATPLGALEYCLDDMDAVLIMTVNPGFAGQKAVPLAVEKIAQTRRFLDARGREGVEIEADGNVSYALAPVMGRNGAELFVAGTSSIFAGDAPIADAIQKLRGLLDFHS